ncbi:MAG: M15 family metallopeptidase [Chitinophagales bacterium]
MKTAAKVEVLPLNIKVKPTITFPFRMMLLCKRYSLLCLLYLLLVFACSQSNEQKAAPLVVVEDEKYMLPAVSPLEKQLMAAGLMNLQDLNCGILVELRYASTNNFLGKNMYGDLRNAYLQPEVAKKLLIAQHLLKNTDSTLTLLVYDAVRPLHIQQLMWDSLHVPMQQKRNFLSDPAVGSLHNYGAAVDLTIADSNGNPLDMGTPYDYIGELAYPSLENQLLQSGRLTAQQVANRQLLRTIMLSAGFTGIDSEWWHFNACSREQAKASYRIIE